MSLKRTLEWLGIFVLKKQVARAVVGASCRPCVLLQTGVQGVAGCSSIGMSAIGVLQHFAAVTALDLAALLAIVIASF